MRHPNDISDPNCGISLPLNPPPLPSCPLSHSIIRRLTPPTPFLPIPPLRYCSSFSGPPPDFLSAPPTPFPSIQVSPVTFCCASYRRQRDSGSHRYTKVAAPLQLLPLSSGCLHHSPKLHAVHISHLQITTLFGNFLRSKQLSSLSLHSHVPVSLHHPSHFS